MEKATDLGAPRQLKKEHARRSSAGAQYTKEITFGSLARGTSFWNQFFSSQRTLSGKWDLGTKAGMFAEVDDCQTGVTWDQRHKG